MELIIYLTTAVCFKGKTFKKVDSGVVHGGKKPTEGLWSEQLGRRISIVQLVFPCAHAGRPVLSGLSGWRMQPQERGARTEPLGSSVAAVTECRAARGQRRGGQGMVSFGHCGMTSE